MTLPAKRRPLSSSQLGSRSPEKAEVGQGRTEAKAVGSRRKTPGSYRWPALEAGPSLPE